MLDSLQFAYKKKLKHNFIQNCFIIIEDRIIIRNFFSKLKKKHTKTEKCLQSIKFFWIHKPSFTNLELYYLRISLLSETRLNIFVNWHHKSAKAKTLFTE